MELVIQGKATCQHQGKPCQNRLRNRCTCRRCCRFRKCRRAAAAASMPTCTFSRYVRRPPGYNPTTGSAQPTRTLLGQALPPHPNQGFFLGAPFSAICRLAASTDCSNDCQDRCAHRRGRPGCNSLLKQKSKVGWEISGTGRS
jgi:hypothetical protein